ncbi:zinc-finger associated domain (zf-AD) domain-containing protein [Phthorimaea operculella]|nr:zinc-finger associated domain (zf-AD) domain-containing protein [Phthorimaea operculella]
MENSEESYCRLCAEPTPADQLISADEDVAVSSKIATKMRWINIDITSNNYLPSTICFSCFDLLERTWSFLHNVRTAQEKLCEIFANKNDTKNGETSSDVKPIETKNAGKPVDKDWQVFKDAKMEIKIDPEGNSELLTLVDPNSLLTLPIKRENDSDNDLPANHTEGFNTTDSDMPLQCTVKRKKLKKKKKIKYDPEISAEDLLKTEIDAEPLDMSALNMTWEDYMCRCAKCDALCKNISSLRDFTNGSNFKKHMKRRHGIDTSKKRYNNIVDDTIVVGPEICEDQNEPL